MTGGHTRWWCTRCRRHLEHGQKYKDTVSTAPQPKAGQPAAGQLVFMHDQCGGPVMPTRLVD